MNPVESIQNKTNQVTEEITKKIKKEITMVIIRKTEPLIGFLLWLIFVLLFILGFVLTGLSTVIIKAILSWNDEITYGSIIIGFLLAIGIGLLFAILIKGFLGRKINKYKQEFIEELE